MNFNSFSELAELVKGLREKTNVAVVAAQDHHTLEAVSHARKEGLIGAYLIGDTEKIKEILTELNEAEEEYILIPAEDAESCMKIAADLVNQGKAGAIMKGKLETGQIMKGILNETVDAAQLKEWNQSGEITGCIVEGPISLDLAMIEEAAQIKGYVSPVSGDADLLVAPDLCAGNLMVKALTEVGGAQTGGLVLGAKVPVILVSRSAKASDKFNSIALAAYMGRK